MRTSASVAALLMGASAAPSKYVQITEGILKGALDAEGFSDIAHCIQDGETLVADAEAAVKDFEEHSISDIVDGFKKVADAVRVIKAGMKDCTSLKADWEKLEAMSVNFENPQSLAWHVAKDLVLNGKDIYSEISTSVADYKKEDWLGFGENIGLAGAKILLGAEEMKKENALNMEKLAEKKKMAAVTAGVLNQFGGKFNIWELMNCIQYEDKAAIAVDIGVQTLSIAAGEWQSDKKKAVTDAFGGLLTLFAAFQSAKQGLPVCESVWQEVEQLDDLKKATEALRLRNSGDVLRLLEDDIQINGFTIIYELSELLAAAKTNDYEQVGDILGKIMKLSIREKASASQEKFVLKAPAVETTFDRKWMAEIIQGFLAGMKVGKIDLLNLLECVNNADQAAMILYQDISMFHEAWAEKDAMEGVAAAITLVGVVQDVKSQVLPVCEAVDYTTLSWTKYDKMFETIEDPTAHINAIEHNVVMNGKTITAELKTAMADFEEEDFFGFGYKVAEALASATDFEDKSLFLY